MHDQLILLVIAKVLSTPLVITHIPARVCGRVIGYQFGHPDGVRYGYEKYI